MKQLILWVTVTTLIHFHTRFEVAQAHVLSTNQDVAAGVLVHTTPDDNPIVGLESEVYFELDDEKYTTEDYVYTLQVQTPAGSEDEIAVTILGELSVASKYIFQEKGTYSFTLTGTPSYISGITSGPVQFMHEQTVTRAKNDPNRLFVVSLATLAITTVLLLYFFVRRKQPAHKKQ